MCAPALKVDVVHDQMPVVSFVTHGLPVADAPSYNWTEEPTGAEPVKERAVFFVMSSVDEDPESDPALRSGVPADGKA